MDTVNSSKNPIWTRIGFVLHDAASMGVCLKATSDVQILLATCGDTAEFVVVDRVLDAPTQRFRAEVLSPTGIVRCLEAQSGFLALGTCQQDTANQRFQDDPPSGSSTAYPRGICESRTSRSKVKLKFRSTWVPEYGKFRIVYLRCGDLGLGARHIEGGSHFARATGTAASGYQFKTSIDNNVSSMLEATLKQSGDEKSITFSGGLDGTIVYEMRFGCVRGGDNSIAWTWVVRIVVITGSLEILTAYILDPQTGHSLLPKASDFLQPHLQLSDTMRWYDKLFRNVSSCDNPPVVPAS